MALVGKGNSSTEGLGQKDLPQDEGIEAVAECIDRQALPSDPDRVECLVKGGECLRRKGEPLHLGPVGPVILEEGHKAGGKGKKGDILSFGTKAGMDFPQFMHGEEFEEGCDLRMSGQGANPQRQHPGRPTPLGTIGLGTQGDPNRNPSRKAGG